MPATPVSFSLALLLASPPAAHKPVGPWQDIASKDVAAYCADVRAIHPGMVDPLTPEFPQRVANACAKAAAKAAKAGSYFDWRDIMQALVTSFRDGHTWISFKLTPLVSRWPGFLIDGQGGHWVVRRPNYPDVAPAGNPPEGATFLGCDGQSAEAFLKDQLDNKTVDWSKLPERIRLAYKGFLISNPDEPIPAKTCSFDADGKMTQTTLQWRPIAYYQLQPLVYPYFRRGASRPTHAEFAPDGHVWIRLQDVGNETVLKALERTLKENQARLRAAHYVVFDLRGNGGGSSEWGERFASILWGEEAVKAAREASQPNDPNDRGKYWRISKAAADGMFGLAEESAAEGPDFAEAAHFWRDLGNKVAAAAASKGDGLLPDECCDEDNESKALEPAPVPQPKYNGKVFVLTDAGCFSSGVLVMNTLKRMGAIQVGEASGQNEIYAEGFDGLKLPSGLGTYRIPFSIIRQPRKELGGLPPDVAWSGAMDDDEGLRKWIARLAFGHTR